MNSWNPQSGLAPTPQSLIAAQPAEYSQVVRREDLGVLPSKVSVHHGVAATSFQAPAPSHAVTAQASEPKMGAPDAHRLYGYGQRQVAFSEVPTRTEHPNRGVHLAHEYLGLPQQPGHQIVHSDEGIQNSHWQNTGPFLRIHDGNYWSYQDRGEALQGADWRQAVDVLGMADARGIPVARRRQPDFHRLYQLRNS
ncbi:unnamed protein product [Effrenium voratum]|uniref:Uncharacterized protein n=1 Tax=Effrenium voratum TaxID=2562239 RepID=A0AA36N688_9DINO|nr:unnamed protein product [Effrenium voratum]CAJ1421130.1 unnamed protein product [Effrenium voratum]